MKLGGEYMGMPDDIAEKTSKHPCYSAEAHTKYARMHLPVAPACNIQCNYCNRWQINYISKLNII